jgi:uridylate kinase
MNDEWWQGWLRGGPGDPTHAARGAKVRGPLVAKFGGSLLARPGWPRALRSFVASAPTGRMIVVVGGGGIVDGVRAMDQASSLPAASAHWLAIDALGLTARIVAESLGLPLVDTPTAVEHPMVLDTPGWLRQAGRADRLPVGWHVTSDSLAALVATELRGTLVLLKSVPPPLPGPYDGPPEMDELASAGWVDGGFPRAAAAIKHIGWAAPRDGLGSEAVFAGSGM